MLWLESNAVELLVESRAKHHDPHSYCYASYFALHVMEWKLKLDLNFEAIVYGVVELASMLRLC